MPGVDLNYFIRQANKLTEKIEEKKRGISIDLGFAPCRLSANSSAAAEALKRSPSTSPIRQPAITPHSAYAIRPGALPATSAVPARTRPISRPARPRDTSQ